MIDLVKKNEDLKAEGKTPMFVDNYDEAANVFGDDFRKINIDPAKQLLSDEAQLILSNGKFAKNGMAEALEKTNALNRKDTSNIYACI